MSNVYSLGDIVRLKTSFKDSVTGDPLDPSSLTLRVLDPTGHEDVFVYGTDAIVRDSTGVFHYDYELPLPETADVPLDGKWSYRWEGTGTAQAADDDFFMVRESPFY